MRYYERRHGVDMDGVLLEGHCWQTVFVFFWDGLVDYWADTPPLFVLFLMYMFCV